MAGPKGPTSLFRACVSTCTVFASSFGAVRAGDLTQATPTPDVSSAFTGWYVRLGALGVLDRSSSNLYEQSIAGTIVPGIGTVPVGVGPQFQITGLGASYSTCTASPSKPVIFSPRIWSLEAATRISRLGDGHDQRVLPRRAAFRNGSRQIVPSSVPITGVYHFTQFGGFQPYLGAGIAPTFAMAVRDGYSTGFSYQPALGFIVQGGFDYMLNKHWGVFVDAKQGFVGTTGNSSGVNAIPPLGPIPITGTTIKTNARPVSFSAGLTYHF